VATAPIMCGKTQDNRTGSHCVGPSPGGKKREEAVQGTNVSVHPLPRPFCPGPGGPTRTQDLREALTCSECFFKSRAPADFFGEIQGTASPSGSPLGHRCPVLPAFRAREGLPKILLPNRPTRPTPTGTLRVRGRRPSLPEPPLLFLFSRGETEEFRGRLTYFGHEVKIASPPRPLGVPRFRGVGGPSSAFRQVKPSSLAFPSGVTACGAGCAPRLSDPPEGGTPNRAGGRRDSQPRARRQRFLPRVSLPAAGQGFRNCTTAAFCWDFCGQKCLVVIPCTGSRRQAPADGEQTSDLLEGSP
jgi:hypothetical protein